MEQEFTSSYLTLDVLRSVLQEFTWPSAFELEDDLPDGIIVIFPKCQLCFSEDYLGEVYLSFLPEDTGAQQMLQVGHAILALHPESERGEGPLTPGLIEDISVTASLEKVQNGLRDLCTIVLTHLQDTLQGDFSWAKAYH
ncbi:MAG TPA: hypothetical protein ENJ82_07110 [Bacteroidetes bacterium]|nr:hypothetical protein [Bacteroidota bacterium]